MDLFNVGCKGCNKYLGSDWFDSPEKAKEWKKECGTKDCETDIFVYP